MAGLGFIFGMLLSWASKKFAIKENQKLKKIIEALPGVNCGACGFPGCAAYAKAVVEGKAPTNLCKIGKEKVTERLDEIMRD